MNDTIPQNWESQPEEVLETEPASTGAILVQRFRSDGDWILDVFDTAHMDEDGPRFQMNLMNSMAGLEHGHTADSVQELRGAVSAITHMANHMGAKDKASTVEGMLEEMEAADDE